MVGRVHAWQDPESIAETQLMGIIPTQDPSRTILKAL
jgi:hypothetical protein